MNLTDIQTKTTAILTKFGVTKAALFGSQARGEAKPTSDIDLLVEFSKNLSLFDVINLRFELEDVLKKKVDLVQYNKIKPSLRNFILRDEKVFFSI